MITLHTASHPSPFPAGWQSQRWEEVLSFVCPGLRKGEKKAASCRRVRVKAGHCVVVAAWMSHVVACA